MADFLSDAAKKGLRARRSADFAAGVGGAYFANCAQQATRRNCLCSAARASGALLLPLPSKMLLVRKKNGRGGSRATASAQSVASSDAELPSEGPTSTSRPSPPGAASSPRRRLSSQANSAVPSSAGKATATAVTEKRRSDFRGRLEGKRKETLLGSLGRRENREKTSASATRVLRRPLHDVEHSGYKSSLLSHHSQELNLRGFFNLFVIVLFVVNSSMVVENILKYGRRSEPALPRGCIEVR